MNNNNNNNLAKYPNIRLGLCCMNITLKYSEKVYCSRKKIFNKIVEQGLESAKNMAIDNVIDLAKMVLWSKNHGIDVMRISSELIVHCTNPKIMEQFGKSNAEEYEKFEFLRPYLEKVGHLAKSQGMRITVHPGQFVSISSPREEVFEASVRELMVHVRYLEMMGMNDDSVMVIHLGGTFGNKSETIERFKNRFRSLPLSIKKYIVLENDEKSYDAEDVLEVCQDLRVPMVLDVFHYEAYGKLHPNDPQTSLDAMMPDILRTWKTRNKRPKFHLSEQAPNKHIGAHSVFVKTIPQILLDIPQKYNTQIDIMIEAKGKEIAIGRLYKKYPELKPPYTDPIDTNLPEKAIKDLGYSDIDLDDDIITSCKC